MNRLKYFLIFCLLPLASCTPSWDEYPSHNSYIPPHYYNQYNPYMYQPMPGYGNPYQPHPYYGVAPNYASGINPPTTYYPQDNDQSYYYNFPPRSYQNSGSHRNSPDYSTYSDIAR